MALGAERNRFTLLLTLWLLLWLLPALPALLELLLLLLALLVVLDALLVLLLVLLQSESWCARLTRDALPPARLKMEGRWRRWCSGAARASGAVALEAVETVLEVALRGASVGLGCGL